MLRTRTIRREYRSRFGPRPLVLIRDDGTNGAENLFARDGHVIPDGGKHGGLYEVAFCETIRSTGPASDQRCTLLNAGINQAQYFIELRLAGQWSDADSIGERITNFCGLGRQPGCYCANRAESGAISLGLRTMVHPVASAGATLVTIWFIGQFQGV